MAVRPGARRVSVDSDARGAILCDRAHLPQLRKLGAQNLDDARKAPRLQPGAYVAYELPTKGGMKAEIVVGAPLTDDEMAGVPWHRPQRSALSIPSGTVVVGGPEMLEDDAASDASVTVQVPPGTYRLTLHRVDRDGWPDVRSRRPPAFDVIVLTATKALSRHSRSPFLPFPRARTGRAGPPLGAVSGDTFTGVVTTHDAESLLLNLGRADARALRLRVGDVLHVTAGPLKLAAFYTGTTPLEEYERLHGRRARPSTGGAWLHPGNARELVVSQVRKGPRLPPGTAAVVRVTERGSVAEPKKWKTVDHDVVGTLTTVARDDLDRLDIRCVTSLDAAALRAAGSPPTTRLRVRLGETECELRLFESEREMHLARSDFSRPAPKIQKVLSGLMKRYMSTRSNVSAARIGREMERVRRAALPQPLPLAGWLAGEPRGRVLEIRCLLCWGSGASLGFTPPLDLPIRKGMAVRLHGTQR